MRNTLTLVFAVAALVLCSAFVMAEDNWTGFISDEHCAKDYEKSSKADHVGCAKGCMSGGGNWALAMKDNHVLLDIDAEQAESHLGKLVIVKGELAQDSNTVKVTSVEVPEN